MKLDELINIISAKTNSFVNQSALAESLGITRQTVSNRIKNESEVTVSELQKVEEFFGITIFNKSVKNQDEIVYLDYYSDVFASCGNGNIVFSDDKITIPLAKSIIKDYSAKKKYSIINASGNSMSPIIDDGDRIVIEHWDGNQIQDNKIYVFCYNNEIFVKRLSKNIDEILIKSDNPEYRTRSINKNKANDLIIIGKVINSIKTLC